MRAHDFFSKLLNIPTDPTLPQSVGGAHHNSEPHIRTQGTGRLTGCPAGKAWVNKVVDVVVVVFAPTRIT